MSCTRKVIRMFFGIGMFILALGLGGSAEGQTWTELFPAGGPSGSILVHMPQGFGYDAANNRLIVYYPSNPGLNSGLSSEVWVLTNANGRGGTPVWMQLTPGGSPPDNINGGTSAVYDEANNLLIVYGGCFFGCSPAQSSVYVLTNANGLGGPPMWVASSVTNPQARDYNSIVYDSATGGMIAFGGGLAFYGTDQNDARILSNANGLASPSTWSTLSTAGGPPGIREEHRAIYDAVNNRMTIFAGTNLITTCCPYVQSDYNDVWVLSNANGQGGTPTWTQLSPLGSQPDPRGLHSAVYDSAHNRMIVFGGLRWNQAAQDYTTLGDLWQLSNANGLGGAPAWTQLTASGAGPGPNTIHAAAFDTANQRMIVFGGAGGSDVYALTSAHKRVWVLDFNTPACVTPPANLVGWWPGDGNANDIAGGNNGALVGGASFAQGVVGQAFSFDGIDDFVSVEDNPSLRLSKVTLSAWINATDVAANGGIITKAQASGNWVSYMIRLIDGGKVNVVVENRGAGSRSAHWKTLAALTNNTWFHVAATWQNLNGDSSDARIYINGVEQPIEMSLNFGYGPTFTPGYSSEPLFIGKQEVPNDGYFGGLIDEAEVYDRVLSASEILAIFNAGSAGKCKNVTVPQLTELGPAKIWLGLKNSDDVGTKFDLLAEVLRNGSVVGSGQLNAVPGGSSGFNNAVLRTINLALSSPASVGAGDTLSIRLSVRIAVGVSGHRSGTARLWLNDSAANSRFGATIGGATIDYFLLDGFTLGAAAGTGPKKTIDVFVDRAAGGNPFKPFGTWSKAF